MLVLGGGGIWGFGGGGSADLIFMGARIFLRKSVVSIKFPPIILGPEMVAPILWAPGIFWFFLLENPHAHKIPPFKGGGSGFF